MKTHIVLPLLLCTSLWIPPIFSQSYFTIAEFGGGSVLELDSLIVVAEFAAPFYGAEITNDIIVTTDVTPPPFLFSQGSTSLKDMPPLTGIRVYPNPAQQNLYLNRSSAESTLSLQIWDAQGILQLEKEWDSGLLTQLDLHKFPGGTYFIRVTDRQALKASVFSMTKL